jgi:hypothetical protein
MKSAFTAPLIVTSAFTCMRSATSGVVARALLSGFGKAGASFGKACSTSVSWGAGVGVAFGDPEGAADGLGDGEGEGEGEAVAVDLPCLEVGAGDGALKRKKQL